MEVRTWNYFAIRVLMRTASKIKTRKNYDMARAILVFTFGKVDAAAFYIKEKVFPFICGDKWNPNLSTETWIVPLLFIYTMLFQRKEQIGF